jgi:tRNA (guanine-N7-)-methyltransferase
MNERSRAEQFPRPVRSYVLRKGRLTPAQARALEELWPRYGIDPGEGHIEAHRLFGRAAPLLVEVGFGNGEATWRMARDEPGHDFIGIEVHPPGVGHLLQALEANGIGNVRIARSDAVDFIAARLEDHCLAGVRIWFPDPWPKKRHHKRRIIQPDFIALLARKLAPGGILHLATDWQPYADHMLSVLECADDFENLSPRGDYCEKPRWRPDTKFERRGERLGHVVRDLLYRRR